MQSILLDALTRRGIQNTLWLHGATQNRGEVVARFQDPEGPKVIIVSLKAGGTGITLTAADTVIYYDPWWLQKWFLWSVAALFLGGSIYLFYRLYCKRAKPEVPYWQKTLETIGLLEMSDLKKQGGPHQKFIENTLYKGKIDEEHVGTIIFMLNSLEIF